MLTIYDSHHIPTNRQRKGHMACRASAGFFVGHADSHRVYYAKLDLINRRFRFAWLVRQWTGHQSRIEFAKEQCA